MSAGLNGDRMYLEKEEIICSIEVFLVGVASNRPIKVVICNCEVDSAH